MSQLYIMGIYSDFCRYYRDNRHTYLLLWENSSTGMNRMERLT